MLEPPPILPERTASGEVIHVDEKLAGATTHRMIFTETSQHKDNQVIKHCRHYSLHQRWFHHTDHVLCSYVL